MNLPQLARSARFYGQCDYVPDGDYAVALADRMISIAAATDTWPEYGFADPHREALFAFAFREGYELTKAAQRTEPTS